VNIPPGNYDVINAAASKSINIGDNIANLIDTYGWRAVPFISAMLQQLPVSDRWRVKIMEMVSEALDPASEAVAE
jgi:hypothetical protein